MSLPYSNWIVIAAVILSLQLTAACAAPSSPVEISDCEAASGVPAPPPPGLPVDPAAPASYERLPVVGSEVDLGVGHIYSTPDEIFPTAAAVDARLPLFDRPRGDLWGWLAKGWLVDLSGTEPQTTAMRTGGLIETGYETLSFIVSEEAPDGWLELRWGVETALRGGTAWLHRCHVESAPSLRFERWEEWFESNDVGPLFFRGSDPRPLRGGPGVDHGVTRPIAPTAEGDVDYHLQPLAIDGDWMRVRLKEPSDYCRSPGEVSPETVEGWIEWRSPELGPLVWYYTRGC